MTTLDRLAPPTTATPAASAWSPRRAIAVALSLAIAIALLQVAQTSGFAHTGQTMQRLERQKTDLQAEIHSLEAEVSALSSLERTDRAARERLGMVTAKRIDYLNVNVEPPSGVLLPRPIIAPDNEQAPADPWWAPLVRILPFN